MKTFEQLVQLTGPLTIDQQRELRGRLKFAGVDLAAMTVDDEAVYADALQAMRTASPPQLRTAALAGSNCPRCQRGLQAVRLADARNAGYCETCKVVVPG